MTLRARNINVALGKKQIIKDASISSMSGQVTAIVGPNGSGKTTLLRALTGDVEYGGSVCIGGHDISGIKAWKLATLRAVLPQATVLAFPFTVIEVVRIGLHQGHAGELQSTATSALMQVGLAGYEDRFYQELSGGEQQRVQLARVLAQVWEPTQDGIPRWLFLDEPVSSLDIGHQLQVMDITRRFATQGGGVVAVMHDLNLTALYADQVIMMSGGVVLAAGVPKEVLTDAVLSKAYGCTIQIDTPPADGTPFVLPNLQHRSDGIL